VNGAAPGCVALYSFRRCPYAIRARMAVLQSGVSVVLREVVLRNKPQALLDASPKATVPVLVLPDGRVIDESLAIMRWALTQNDTEGWMCNADEPVQQRLVALNDGPFKQALDAYKYPERHPDQSAAAHRAQGEAVLVRLLEACLGSQPFLAGTSPGFSDAAIFPFVRQWAAVDTSWFEASPWQGVRRWLHHWQNSPAFLGTMAKHAPWQPGYAGVPFPA
jgi:glutathione S-transferase